MEINCSILKEKEYLIQINNAIDAEISRYNMEFNKSDMRGNENISYNLFLEVILLRIRGENTIKKETVKERGKTNQ